MDRSWFPGGRGEGPSYALSPCGNLNLHTSLFSVPSKRYGRSNHVLHRTERFRASTACSLHLMRYPFYQNIMVGKGEHHVLLYCRRIDLRCGVEGITSPCSISSCFNRRMYSNECTVPCPVLSSQSGSLNKYILNSSRKTKGPFRQGSKDGTGVEYQCVESIEEICYFPVAH